MGNTALVISSVSVVVSALVLCGIVHRCDGVALPIFVNRNSSNAHLVVHKISGQVFVGATNKIYQLSSSLEVVGVKRIGPFEDSYQCLTYYDAEDRQCVSSDDAVQSQIVDNVNKALVIDYDRAQLIHCGSVFQGICWISSLDNFTSTRKEPEMIKKPVVANDPEASTVAFIAPGPPYPNIHKVLNVAVTYTGNSPYRSEVPAVSSRRLTGHKGELLDVVQDDKSLSDSGVEAAIAFLEDQDFRAKYVYGFSSKGFSYFLTIQRTNSLGFSRFSSKIIRICHKDSSYKSYAEIPLACKDRTSSKYFPLVQSAFLGKAGTELARDLDDAATDDVLYATFSTAQPTGSWNASADSALCIFPMRDIRKKFQENIQECFSGRGYRGAEHIQPQKRCERDMSEKISENFCGSDINSPLGGLIAAETNATVSFNAFITGIAVTTTGEFTVAFLGTRKGAVKKVVIENLDTGIEYESVTIDSPKSILPDMKFDPSKTHLYVMTKSKVQRMNLHVHLRCDQRSGCGDCLQDGDPFCGWCPSLNRCMDNAERHACPKSSTPTIESPNWLSYKTPEFCPNEMALCPDLAETCSTCLSLDAKYDCGWCVEKSNCLQVHHCQGDSTWINETNRCNLTPFIEFFEPTSGPVEGGTNVTIGVPNIYKHMTGSTTSLMPQVTIAGTPCKVISNVGRTFTNLVPDEKIVCRIQRSPKSSLDMKSVRSGPIVVQIQDFRLESKDKFSFVNPTISEIVPSKGPIRGGSKLKVLGENLGTGSDAKVFIGNVPCDINRRSGNVIECVTREFFETGGYSVRANFDGNDRSVPSSFSFVPNPEIYRTKPNVIHGTLRGGYHVNAEGTNFDGVQNASFVVILNETEYKGSCNVTSPSVLHCITPNIDQEAHNLKGLTTAEGVEEDMVILNFKFQLDTVDTYINDKPEDKHEYFLRLTHHHHDHESSTSTILISLALVVLFVLLAGFLYVLYKRYKLHRRIYDKSAMLTETELKEFLKGKPSSVEKGVLPVENPYVIPYNQKFEITERRFTIDMDDLLGSGMFGLVLRGSVDGAPVAVKTLKSDGEKMHLTALMSELKILIHLGNFGRHPNIVNLVGACTRRIDAGMLYMFVEYCPLGSLDKRLRTGRRLFCDQIANDIIDLNSSEKKRYENVDSKDIICTYDLVSYAHQVAKGMEYLAEKKVIHADLAARNLLLLNQTTVKITDFGLARKLYDYTNYVKKQQEPLPWRWMAIESLQDLSFSAQSDVWAYGITLWEMFTLGEMPYPGLSWSVDFTDRLVHGLKNVKPKFATTDIYNTMLECWQHKPEDRPTFGELRKFFNAVLLDLSAQVQDARDDEGYLVPLLGEPSATEV